MTGHEMVMEQVRRAAVATNYRHMAVGVTRDASEARRLGLDPVKLADRARKAADAEMKNPEPA